MSKEMLVIALGAVVALTTQIGIPGSWKMTILFAVGVGIAVIGFLLRGEAIGRGPAAKAPRRSDTFTESFADERTEGINSLN